MDKYRSTLTLYTTVHSPIGLTKSAQIFTSVKRFASVELQPLGCLAKPHELAIYAKVMFFRLYEPLVIMAYFFGRLFYSYWWHGNIAYKSKAVRRDIIYRYILHKRIDITVCDITFIFNRFIHSPILNLCQGCRNDLITNCICCNVGCTETNITKTSNHNYQCRKLNDNIWFANITSEQTYGNELI